MRCSRTASTPKRQRQTQAQISIYVACAAPPSTASPPFRATRAGRQGRHLSTSDSKVCSVALGHEALLLDRRASVLLLVSRRELQRRRGQILVFDHRQ